MAYFSEFYGSFHIKTEWTLFIGVRVYSKTALGGGEEELLDKYTTEETKI